MIEINLVKKSSSFELPTVIGINFNQINFKILIIAYIATTIPDWLILPEFKKSEAEVQKLVDDKQTKLKLLKAEINKSTNLEDQLDAFNKQIEKLKERSKQVEKIINEKTNPQKLLERVARSMPEDLWLSRLEITTKDEIFMSGFSNTYKSIGDFIATTNDTPFFGKSLILSKSGVLEDKKKSSSARLEQFEIKGEVQTYEPFGRDM